MAATPQVVIMAPVRELVTQIYDEARKFCGGTNLRCSLVYGGTSVQNQLLALGQGCNILVATPGRLLDPRGATKGARGHRNSVFFPTTWVCAKHLFI